MPIKLEISHALRADVYCLTMLLVIEIRRGISTLPAIQDVTDDDVRTILDPEAKGVPELSTNTWLAAERERLEKQIAQGESVAVSLAKSQLAMYLALQNRIKTLELANDALRIAEEIDDTFAVACAKRSLGVACSLGPLDMQKAATLSLEAEYLFNDLGDTIREGAAMTFRMFDATLSGAYSTAAALEEPILGLLGAPGDDDAEWTRLTSISIVYWALGYIAREARHDRALFRRYTSLRVAFARAAPEPLFVAQAHDDLALMLIMNGEEALAKPHAVRQRQIARRNHSIEGEINGLCRLAYVFVGTREFGAARDTIAEADGLIKSTDDAQPGTQLVLDGARVLLLIKEEKWEQAEALMNEVTDAIERSPRRNLSVSLRLLIMIYEGQGTMHEHLDVYERLVEEMDKAARESGPIQLGALETRRSVEKQKQEQRADKLLRAIVPHQAYVELIESGESAPRYYPNTVVFFSDFAGFTRIAAALSPRQIIEELSDLFETNTPASSAVRCSKHESAFTADQLSAESLDEIESATACLATRSTPPSALKQRASRARFSCPSPHTDYSMPIT